jgi:hypothetical protein
METTRHESFGLRLALLNPLTCLDGGGLQLLQLLLRRVVGRLDDLMLTVKIRQHSHEFTFGVGMSFIPYPLVLTPVA